MMNILDIAMQENDAGAKTIRHYLHKLLKTLWQEGEDFSGKRPFGNSGWEYDLYIALCRAKAITGEIDNNGGLLSFDEKAANTAIFNAIDAMSGF